MKILILGHARHGKDTVGDMIAKHSNLVALSSSVAALYIFMFDLLNKKYKLNYKTKEQAFLDRVNHRKIWYDEITKYNRYDKIRLAKEILKVADIYTGLRNYREVEACIDAKVFDTIIGVYNYRLPHESTASNTTDLFKYADYIITNNGTLKDLENKIVKLFF